MKNRRREKFPSCKQTVKYFILIHMLSNEEVLEKLEQLMKPLHEGQQRLEQGQKHVEQRIDAGEKNLMKKIDTVDMKVERVNSNLDKTQEQILDTIRDVADEIIAEVGKQRSHLETRVDTIEEKLHITKH